MPDVIKEFFEGLGARRNRLLKPGGSLRIDLTSGPQTDCWYLLFGEGRVRASRGPHDVDTVIQTDRAFFEQLIRGDANIMSAWLRNRVKVAGDVYLLDLFRRLLPKQADARDPRIRPRPEEQLS